MRRYLKRIWRRLANGHDDGIAAMEFALLTPAFIVLLAGTVDIGGVVSTKFRLDTAVAAASNFVLVNASSVSSSAGATLATNIASVVTTSESTTNGSVVVNNGPTATISSGSASSGGTAANADLCYCPTGSTNSLTWGSAVGCGSTCASGLLAGKFVLITINYTSQPVFTKFNFMQTQ